MVKMEKEIEKKLLVLFTCHFSSVQVELQQQETCGFNVSAGFYNAVFTRTGKQQAVVV